MFRFPIFLTAGYLYLQVSKCNSDARTTTTPSPVHELLQTPEQVHRQTNGGGAGRPPFPPSLLQQPGPHPQWLLCASSDITV